jgi:hypothetical protein
MFHRERRKPSKDYLKYFRVIRKFVQVKHGLKLEELEMLFFLHSEDYFSRDKFDEFAKIMPWNRQRFDKLKREGWIEIFRKRTGKYKALYQLSYKGTRLVNYIYRKLDGGELPVTRNNNPMFGSDPSYTDKVYRNMIIEMNQERRKLKNDRN